MTRSFSWRRRVQRLAIGLVALAFVAACGGGDGGARGTLPENIGYLRATDGSFGKLTIFDADTFEVYRTLDLPQALPGDSHRLERDDKGRIWIGYSQEYTSALPGRMKEEVLIYSADGELEHVVDTRCGPPEGGIAFANGYAFIGCVASGFKARVVVVDTQTMEIVKTIEGIRPEGPGLSDRFFHQFFAAAVEEVDGAILIIGKGRPPRNYDKVTNHLSGVAMVAAIDLETLTTRGYNTEFPPGSKVLDAIEVDGKAWLLNSYSHIAERPPRTDVYVIDPKTLEIVDNFNLPHPYPVWGRNVDGTVYIFHRSLTKWGFIRASPFRLSS